MKSVVFMGTPAFAVPILKAILASPDYQIKAVVTQPDRRVGRKRVLKASPVKEIARVAGIEVLAPEKINHSPEMERIIELSPDLIITAAFGQFLPVKLLASAQIAAINVHASLLPKYRGGAPVQYAIMNGDQETGVTIMYMVKQMDAGNIIAQQAVPITPRDDAGTMLEKLSLVGRDLLMATLPKIIAGTVVPIPQNDEQVTFAPNISPAQEEIDYTLPADQIDNQIRGLRPAPIANIMLGGSRTKIYDITPLPEKTSLQAGKIVRVGKHVLVLAAGAGTTYKINRLQPAGKSLMDITAYLNGHRNLKSGMQIISHG